MKSVPLCMSPKGWFLANLITLCLQICIICIYGTVFLYIGSNILLKMTCDCTSAVECVCYGTDGRGTVTALLSDFDLVETAKSDDKWTRLRDREPSGTRGMKAPEVNKYM